MFYFCSWHGFCLVHILHRTLALVPLVHARTRFCFLQHKLDADNHPDLNGGAKEDRTPDLLRARQALSQLSYGPFSLTIQL